MTEPATASPEDRLLDGVRVVDLCGEPGAMAGRILADLGAHVVVVEPDGGSPLRAIPPLGPDGVSLRWAAWRAGCSSSVVAGPDDPDLAAALRDADVVLATPGWPGTVEVDPAAAPGSVWVEARPFGAIGPRSSWRASDLGVMASSGNLFGTGEPDRAPLRCAEPTGYAHTGPEMVVAALTGLASGRPQRIDLSMQETVQVANMCAAGRYTRERFRGGRRGANIGRTREIWPARDGYVSFGLRGGKARVPSLELITKLVRDAGIDASALEAIDWASYSPNEVDDEQLRSIEEPIAAYFAQTSIRDLYAVACDTNLMLAPINGPGEILDSAQLAAREVFGPVGPYARFPRSFVVTRVGEGLPHRVARPGPSAPAPALGWQAAGAGAISPRTSPRRAGTPARARAWEGTLIIELGSGAAGPIAGRYFAEHGATVIRIESRSRPDFLRTYALGPGNPHGLEGSGMFDALNAGKRSITLDLKHPEGVGIAKALVARADAVAENFAPKAMRGFGLDYDTLAVDRPDLVMISACLNGQTGPHRDYPGFGGQGSALAGFNFLTGWPDREPVGPFGTITDSLAPRFVGSALAAGLLYRRRTGRGVYLDLSQVEAGVWSLAPWLLDHAENAHTTSRSGNRSDRAAPHGVFPCEGRDRWVAIACWSDADWARLAEAIGVDDPRFATLAGRLDAVDHLEAAVSAWTAPRRADEVAEQLQGLGIEAVPVANFADLAADPTLHARDHFVPLDHPALGPGSYERNGFRLSDGDGGFDRPSPLLGEHTTWVLTEILGLSPGEQARLQESGALD